MNRQARNRDSSTEHGIRTQLIYSKKDDAYILRQSLNRSGIYDLTS